MQTLAAEEGVGVSAGNGGGKASVSVAAQGFVIGVQAAQEAVEDGRRVVITARNLLQRNGVGRGAAEDGLVQVDADAGNAAADAVALQYILDEHAADFLLVPVDVVGPLDGDVVRLRVQFFLDGQRDNLRQDELAACLDETGIEHGAEQEVLPGFGLPRVAALALARRLEAGGDGSIFGRGGWGVVAQVAQVTVGRVGFFQPDDWKGGLFRSCCHFGLVRKIRYSQNCGG